MLAVFMVWFYSCPNFFNDCSLVVFFINIDTIALIIIIISLAKSYYNLLYDKRKVLKLLD